MPQLLALGGPLKNSLKCLRGMKHATLGLEELLGTGSRWHFYAIIACYEWMLYPKLLGRSL